jgi:hypothetical protein
MSFFFNLPDVLFPSRRTTLRKSQLPVSPPSSGYVDFPKLHSLSVDDNSFQVVLGSSRFKSLLHWNMIKDGNASILYLKQFTKLDPSENSLSL